MLTNRIMAASYKTGIRYVGGITGTKSGSTSGYTTLSLTNLRGGESTGTVANDMVIACFVVGGSWVNQPPTLSITDGANEYTKVGGIQLYQTGITPYVVMLLSYKILSNTETTVSFGPTSGLSYTGALAVHVWRGVDTTTPLDVTPVNAKSAGSPLANPPAITPITPGSVIIAAGGAGKQYAGSYSSPDLSNFISTGINEIYGAMVGIGSYNWVSGSYDPEAFVTTITSNACWAAWTLALRPAPQ